MIEENMSLMIACIFLCIFSGYASAAEPLSESDYDIHFAARSVTHGMFLSGLGGDVTEFTICLWIQTKTSPGTLFSYALPNTRSGGNDLLIDYGENQLAFEIVGTLRKTSVYLKDGKWHQICVAWRSGSGSWWVYKDGVEELKGTNLKKGYTLGGQGSLVIGQEQDTFGGGFEVQQSLVGMMTNINMWDTKLSEEEIAQMWKSCRAGEGNLLKWADFLNKAYKVEGSIVMPSLCRPLSG